ncbi:Zn-dependent alcohol dehydrogenase [Chelativorans sp. ZYF759]|uniref:Zn-dependent alcohol dehydrogenase n=1 Tax=Chelativorans sp. ZYF759 TaxID=2692213 RepID=UPI0034D51763
MPRIKAAVCRAFGQPLVVEELVLDEPAPNEVMVDVKACAICHSDIFFAEGAWGGDLPAVYGHEAAGIVSAVGPGVEDVAPGDHVVVTLIRFCGGCHYCRRGQAITCEEVFARDAAGPLKRADGGAVVQAMHTGAFAEKALVHVSQVVKIPADMAFPVASLLACGVITGFGAVTNTARVAEGDTAAVIGCGGVGLNSIQGARISGARAIVALDIDDAKLEAARHFGATHAFNPMRDDAAAEIMKITEGRGIDHAFVTVGAKAAFDGAFAWMGRFGQMVVVGMPPSGVMAEYDPGTMAAWNQRIVGSKMGESTIATDIPMLVALYREGRLKLDELVTRTYRLGEINEAIADVKAGRALRNVIVFD